MVKSMLRKRSSLRSRLLKVDWMVARAAAVSMSTTRTLMFPLTFWQSALFGWSVGHAVELV